MVQALTVIRRSIFLPRFSGAITCCQNVRVVRRSHWSLWLLLLRLLLGVAQLKKRVIGVCSFPVVVTMVRTVIDQVLSDLSSLHKKRADQSLRSLLVALQLYTGEQLVTGVLFVRLLSAGKAVKNVLRWWV